MNENVQKIKLHFFMLDVELPVLYMLIKKFFKKILKIMILYVWKKKRRQML